MGQWGRRNWQVLVVNFSVPIDIDINNKKGPNKAGSDYFAFLLGLNGEIIPMGTSYYKPGYLCQYNNNSNKNGPACTAWVLYKGNMDYLRKDISW